MDWNTFASDFSASRSENHLERINMIGYFDNVIHKSFCFSLHLLLGNNIWIVVQMQDEKNEFF